MSADLVRQLSALGLNLEQVIGVMEIMDAEAESRREKGRERWHKWKDKKATNVSQQATNVSSQLAGVEDSSSKKDNNKEEKKEGRSRATRLPADWVIPNDWLQEAVDAGLSLSQAQASATRMHRWSMSEPKGAKLNWHSTWQNWFERDLPKPHSTASPQQPRNAGERAMLKLRNGMIDHEPPSPSNGRLDTGNGRRQIEGSGIARQFASQEGT